MSNPSVKNKIVRMRRDQIPRATAKDLERLRAGMEAPIDTSDIPEWDGGGVPVRLDADGNLPRKIDSPLRTAILKELGKRGMNRVRLLKEARVLKGSLEETAVYEFLWGFADISTADAQALLEALDMTFVLGAKKKKTKKATVAKKPAKKTPVARA